MLFNTNKNRRIVLPNRRVAVPNRRTVVPRKSLVRPRHQPPSWKSFKTQKRPTGRRGPLVNIRTPRLVVSDIRQFALKVTYNLLFILLAIGIIYFLFFSEWLQISNILVEGNKSTDKKLILDVVEPYLHKKSFFFFPSNNFFFIPTHQIGTEILSDFKRIGDVQVSRGFPNSLAIRVAEKKAVLLFCSNNGCVWVDEEGVAYNKSSYADAIADSSDVVIVQDNSHSDLVAGQLVTDPAYVDFANRLWHSFPDKIGKELVYLSTPLPSAQEIRVNTKEGWTVYIDTTVDLERSLGLLKNVIDQELKDKEGGTTCLDYIDLRVTDRVFYKMKDNCSPNGGDNQNPDSNNPLQNNNANDNQQQVDQANPDQQVQQPDNGNTNTNKDKKTKKKKKKN